MTAPSAVRPLRWILLAAFAAMFAQDVLGTSMVIFEAHYNATWAAIMDQAQWMTAIVSQGLTLESIINDGWRSRRTWAIFAVVSAANVLGTYSGVAVGQALR